MRCTAIAESTGERCRRHAAKGVQTCGLHTPSDWNPRLTQPVTIPRSQVEALMEGEDELFVDHLLLVMWQRIQQIEHSNLGLLAKVNQSLPVEDTFMRAAVLRRVLKLCQEANDLLTALDAEDAEDCARMAFPKASSERSKLN